MDFTFGICTYNSEKFIIQALESVKYQVTMYGQEHNVILIVADDCSTDNTIKMVQHWMETNKQLFMKSVLLRQEENYGIAHNYAKLLDNIYTQYFKTMDGDDILSSVNIFEQIKNVESGELKIFFPIRFNDKGMYIEEADYISMFYYHKCEHEHKKDLHMLETIKPFITPEVCFLRYEYSNKTGEFVRKFNQFEDDTSLYYMFKNNNDMKMKFVLEPMVLYRVHNKSLSNGVESIANIKFLDDLHKFKKYVLKNESNLGVKIILIFAIIDTFRMKHRFDTKVSFYRNIVNYYAKKRKKDVEKCKEFSEYKIRMQRIMDNEKKHLNVLEQNSQKYFGECN